MRSLLRFPTARLTNAKLFVALLLTFATGVGAVSTGSERGRWVVIAHGIAAITVVVLIPWKTRVVRAGLTRRRASRWASLTLVGLVVLTLLTGLGYASGLVLSIGGVAGMWLHVALALTALPLIVWHVAARRTQVRATDLSRRTMLRTGLIGACAAVIYVGLTAVVTLAGAPGARRRFTGSYEVGSFDPASMPNTIWLDDSSPEVNSATWRLTVVDAVGRYELTLSELMRHDVSRRAVLDCTSGWYAEQDWTGVPVRDLIRDAGGDAGGSAGDGAGDARSLYVHSLTGYWIRFPVEEIDQLLLATRVGVAPLSRGHGYPLRLVAPNRRGFWWVKWIDRIELDRTPPWWQPPLPLS